MTNHQLWLDTLNMARVVKPRKQQGKPLSEALTLADSVWPFKYVNGSQTAQSEALERDKKQHKRAKMDVSDFEDALI